MERGRAAPALGSSLTPGPPPQSVPRSGGTCAGASAEKTACVRGLWPGPPSPSMTAAVARVEVGEPSAILAHRAALVSMPERGWPGGNLGAGAEVNQSHCLLTAPCPSQGPSARRRRVRVILSGTRAPCCWGSPPEVSVARGTESGPRPSPGAVLTSHSLGPHRRGQLGGGFGRVSLRERPLCAAAGRRSVRVSRRLPARLVPRPLCR